MRSIRLAWAAMVAVVGVLTGACTPDDTAGAALSGARPIPPPELPRVTLVGQPLWTTNGATAPMPVGTPYLTGPDLITQTITRTSTTAYQQAIGVLDVASGAPRWSIYDRTAIPGGTALYYRARNYPLGPSMAYAAASNTVVVPTFLSSCPDGGAVCTTAPAQQTPAFGVSGLDRTDGRLRWNYTAIPAAPFPAQPTPDGQELDVEVVAATDDSVVINIGPSHALLGIGSAHPSQTRTVLIDATTGAELWSAPGRLATQIAGDRVLCRIPSAESGPGQRNATPCAIDLATGAPVWTLSGDFEHAEITAVVGDRAVVQATSTAGDAEDGQALVLLADGTVTEQLGVLPALGFGDGAVAIGISIQEGRHYLASLGPDDSGVQVGAEVESLLEALGFADGYVVLGSRGSATPTYLTDRWGNLLSDSLPGRVLVFDGQHIVLTTETDPMDLLLSDHGQVFVFATQ